MIKKPAYEMDLLRSREPHPTVEVDTDSMQAAGLHLAEVASLALNRFAERNPTQKATIYQYGTSSINFGEPCWSEFLIVVGSEKVLRAVNDAFLAHPEVKSRFSDYIPPRDGQPRFHIEGGRLWEVLDGAEWFSKDGGEQEPKEEPALIDEEESEDMDLVSSDDENLNVESNGGSDQDEVEGGAPVRRGRLRAARSDAKVGSIRETIEELFGLPAGSVALCGPNHQPLRADATIGTLRRRWEES